MATTLEIALSYLQRGWRVIPLRPNTKQPTASGWQNLRLSENDLSSVFRNPHMGIGVILGEGLVDIDLDSTEAVELAPYFLPRTEAIFGRASKRYSHWMYYVSDTVQHRTFTDPKADGPGQGEMLLELRSAGHQTMVPGSIHPSGEEVLWEKSGDPGAVDAAELTEGIGRLAAAVLLSRYWPDRGGRHIASMALAGALFRMGWGLAHVEDFVHRVCHVAGDDEISDRLQAIRDTEKNQTARDTTGWPTLAEVIDRDIVRLIRSWLSIGIQTPRFNLTDEGNAERLTFYFGDDVRYAEDSDAWFAWDGHRWTRDNKSNVRILELATAVNEKVIEEARREPDEERQKALYKWAFQGGNVARMSALVKVAKAQTSIRRYETTFDLDAMLLNCTNGTLNLVTGGLQPWSRDDYLTKTTGIPYVKAASCPMWMRFLDRIMDGDQDMIGFLRRAVGFSITGSKTQAVFICYGTGANGKTTFLETVRTMLGEYARNTSPSTFAADNRNAIRSDIARLRGARYVTCTELEPGAGVATATLKYITGGERITARELYQSEIEYTPVFKPWLACNTRPGISDHTEGMWRRIRLIPFTVQIPDAEQDTTLPQRLVERELTGILSWAVSGAREWLRDGLQEPEKVVTATAQYRADTDVIGDFVDSLCIVAENITVPTSSLYQAYVGWCSSRSQKPLSAVSLATRLRDRGFITEEGPRGKQWRGVALRVPVMVGGSQYAQGEGDDTFEVGVN